ncbi:MAG: cytochrome c maturation protein CcmE [Piscirickettsiaceae bacterium]|nr:cytochrome c maturation protein CcmE [Piscirickettsiaceae bacterium]
MTPKRRQRLMLIIVMVVGVSIAVGLILKAFNQNLMYFYTTTEVKEGIAPQGQMIRLGGLVVEGSVNRPNNDVTIEFKLTDNQSKVTVLYSGILPDLFREGQGILAHGRLNQKNIFIADEVLAKHDENYMPPEVADSLQQAQ